MIKQATIKVVITLLLVALCFVTFLILVPREYNAPRKRESSGAQYWNLNTGSKIAYTFLKVEVYTVDRHIMDLEEIIRTIGAEKVILIGQSWGASLAALYIADHPDRIERAIFTGPGPMLPLNREVEAINPPDSLDLKAPFFTNKMGREKAYNIRTRFIELLARKFNWKLASDSEMDDFASILNYQMNKSTVCDTSRHGNPEPGYGYYCMVKTVQSFASVKDRRAKLKQCDIPLLILRGQCDGIKWGYVDEYSHLFTNCAIKIIRGAGHSVARENPETYMSTIRAYLQHQHPNLTDHRY